MLLGFHKVRFFFFDVCIYDIMNCFSSNPNMFSVSPFSKTDVWPFFSFFSIFFFKLMPTSLYYSSGTNNHWQMTLGQVEHIHLTCCPYLYYFFHSGHSSRPPKSCRAAWFYYFKITNHIFFCQLLWCVVLITVELCHRRGLKKRKKWKLSTSKKNGGGLFATILCSKNALCIFTRL